MKKNKTTIVYHVQCLCRPINNPHVEKCKKKSFNIHSYVRPKCPTKTNMSDQIVGLREC
jgi:hypothetical protein